MGPWEIVGIEPTDDRRAIKRAYAKKLKLHRPDEDPEGFQQLNEAYEYIVENLDYLLAIENAEPKASENTPEPQTEPVQQVAEIVEQPEQEHSQQTEIVTPVSRQDDNICVDDSEALPELKPYDDILAEFRGLLLKPDDGDWNDEQREQRCIEQWHDFLTQNEFYDIDYKADITIDVFAQLIQFHHQRGFINLPLAVKTQLMEVFLWQDQELELCRYFEAGDVDVVLRQMRAGQESTEEEYVPQMQAEDIQIDPIVYKMLGGIVVLLMAFVLAL